MVVFGGLRGLREKRVVTKNMVFKRMITRRRFLAGVSVRDAVPLAVGRWYDFHEFGCHPGNVG